MVPLKHSLGGSLSASSSQVMGAWMFPSVVCAPTAASIPFPRVNALSSESPTRFAFTPEILIGGTHEACSASPPGSGTVIRGRGSAKRKSVCSGPFPGRQIVGVVIAESIFGRYVASSPISKEVFRVGALASPNASGTERWANVLASLDSGPGVQSWAWSEPASASISSAIPRGAFTGPLARSEHPCCPSEQPDPSPPQRQTRTLPRQPPSRLLP